MGIVLTLIEAFQLSPGTELAQGGSSVKIREAPGTIMDVELFCSQKGTPHPSPMASALEPWTQPWVCLCP